MHLDLNTSTHERHECDQSVIQGYTLHSISTFLMCFYIDDVFPYTYTFCIIFISMIFFFQTPILSMYSNTILYFLHVQFFSLLV